MAAGGLTAQSLQPGVSGFNWIFLVELIVAGTLALFYLFYFNRVFATLVSSGLRAYTWHFYRVHIDIQALQFSLLAGRIFFKGFQYYGENETILVQGGYITWRYWLRNVREAACYSSSDPEPTSSASTDQSAEDHDVESKNDGELETAPEMVADRSEIDGGTKKPPCRLVVSLQGFEWFVYNRSAAYDAVIASMSCTDQVASRCDENPDSETSSSKVLDSTVVSQTTKADAEGLENPHAKPKRHHLRSRHPKKQRSVKSEGNSNAKPGRGMQEFDKERKRSRSNATASEASSISDSPEAAEQSEEILNSAFLSLLPIGVECSKGAIVMGNSSTQCILSTKFEKAHGDINAGHCPHSLDQYRQLFNFQFIHPVIQMKPNMDFKGSEAGLKTSAQESSKEPKADQMGTHRTISEKLPLWRRIAQRVSSLELRKTKQAPETEKSNLRHEDPAQGASADGQWIGLSRYLNKDLPEDQDKWAGIDYARFSTVFDGPSLTMTLYWDVPGKVAQPSPLIDPNTLDEGDINGSKSPAWGISLRLQDGTINYGPWADRQRAELQTAFFPRFFTDSIPGKRLKPGESRISTVFRLYMELDGHTVLRIPTREKSKDWKWKPGGVAFKDATKNSAGKAKKTKKHEKSVAGPEVRPFGWLDVKIPSKSTISYVADMTARRNGFQAHLAIDLPGTELWSSVNHGVLWRTAQSSIFCDLSTPLEWNNLRTWVFNLAFHGLELFLLRDHIFLLSDLIDDWGSGPPSEYYTFTPFEYIVKFSFPDFKIYLNVNDFNVINSPCDLEDNTFIIIRGEELVAEVLIPLDTFRPSSNEISFTADARNGGLDLHVPPWNTQASFLDSREVAHLKELTVRGSYNYFTAVQPSLMDTLVLHVHGRAPSISLFGFLIRYLIKIKDNYLGDDIHFKTLDEYEALHASKHSGDKEEATKEHAKISNGLDVLLNVEAEDCSILLPTYLYSSKEHVRLDLGCLSADLRFTNYYMDLEVNFSPLSVYLGRDGDAPHSPLSTTTYGTQAFVDGVNIYGHRLFGLPPTEPTYVCNWDFSVGSVTGECSSEFLIELASALRNIIFLFDDEENALPLVHLPTLHDVTFLRARIKPVRLWFHVENSAFMLSSDEISLDFNDWAREKFSERLSLLIPNLTLACVDAESASRHRSRKLPAVDTHAYIQTTVEVSMIEVKPRFSHARSLQQEHVRQQDSRTHRTPFLLLAGGDTTSVARSFGATTSKDSPSMPFPPMPEVRLGPRSSDQPEATELFSDSKFITKSQGESQRISLQGDEITKNALSVANSRLSPASRTVSSQSLSSPTLTRDFSTVSRAQLSPHDRGDSFHGLLSGRPDKYGLAPSSMTFTSPFAAPYFPLEAVEPDTTNVPALSEEDPDDDPIFDPDDSLIDNTPAPGEEQAQVSFIVNLRPGVKAYIDPDAIHSVVQLMADMQPKTPERMLDALQADVMEKVFAFVKNKIRVGRTTDMSLNISSLHIRLSNSALVDSGQGPNCNKDIYELQLSRLCFKTRSRIGAQDEVRANDGSKMTALHVSLDSLRLTVRETRFDGSSIDAAAIADVKDLVLWSALDKIKSATLQLRSLEVAMASEQVDYLALLLYRISAGRQKLENAFLSVSVGHQKRLRDTIYALTSAGKDAADPSFMTRPSYLLRFARDHPRVSDSWKILSRLRGMYQSLSAEERASLNAQPTTLTQPREDPGLWVIEMFNKWRGSELHHVERSFVMRAIYGSPDLKDVSDTESRSGLTASLTTGALRFLVDPGPNQSEIGLKTVKIGAYVNLSSTSPADEIPNGQSEPNHITIIESYAADVAIKLNWELWDLAKNLLALRNDNGHSLAPEVGESHTTTGAPTPYQYHLVFNVGLGIVELDGINLRSISRSENMIGSFFLSGHQQKEGNIDAHFALHSDAASTEFSTPSRVLSSSRLRNPNLNLSLNSLKQDDGLINLWKFAATCQELSFRLEDELPGLVEVLDAVIGDEITYIQQFSNQMKLQQSQEPSLSDKSPPKGEAKTRNDVHVALFLDSYHLEISMLHSLKYVISGNIARTAIAPGRKGEMTIDFDLEKHSHQVKTQSEKSTQAISTLEMPPINGRVISRLTESENYFEIYSSIESILLDAEAIHNLLDTINRPEVTKVADELQTDYHALKEHLQEIVTSSHTQPSKAPKSKPLIYVAHITIAGLGIHASAPVKHSAADSADLRFTFGCVQINALNRLGTQGPPMPYPETHIGLKQIELGLTRTKDGVNQSCGNLGFGAYLNCTSAPNSNGDIVRAYHVKSGALEVNLFTETIATIVEVIGHLQDQIKNIDISSEVQYLRKLRKRKSRPLLTRRITRRLSMSNGEDTTNIFNAIYSLEMLNIQISWIVGNPLLASPISPSREPEDLVLSFKRIDLTSTKESSARLAIVDFQLQMVPTNRNKVERSLNSALLPDIVFNVAYLSTEDDRSLAFQAAGKSLDLRLTSHFILPANDIRSSMASAAEMFRVAAASWKMTPKEKESARKSLLSNKRLRSLLVDADFAGAVVYLQGRRVADSQNPAFSLLRSGRVPQHGRYGQFTQEDATGSTTLRAPGVAMKIEYKDNGTDDPSLNTEIKVDASTNILYPTIVPLIMELSSSVKDTVGESEEPKETFQTSSSPSKAPGEDNVLKSDPSAILGRTRLNLGVRICKQEFSLSCQPIARVAATAKFDDIYITTNTVKVTPQNQFLAISAAFTGLQASVQHVYSRDSTGSFQVDTIFLSLMNSRHVSGTSGVSAILKFSPIKSQLNVRQLQDFLLFREIWIPPEVRQPAPPVATPSAEPQTYLVQRYQQVAAASAFPWNATIAVEGLSLQLDLGQSLGKSALTISNLWVSSKKSTSWEQNLCLGFERVGIESVGRMSGFVEMHNFRVRTSIRWTSKTDSKTETPLVEASVVLEKLRLKAVFDYQAFLMANATALEFLMYNVREQGAAKRDRLVGIVGGDEVQMFCTMTSAAQGIALYQAFERLIQEKKAAYSTSLKDIEKFLRRKSVLTTSTPFSDPTPSPKRDDEPFRAPTSLHTDVVVTLRSINFGAFPSTFNDAQILRLEASDAQARFAVATETSKIQSGLTLTLGQLRVALSAVNRPTVPKSLGDITVEDVIASAAGSRGGVILRVPRVVAMMQTWQALSHNQIEYIFKSSFEGKVDVGWNYSRISFIRGMWASHTKALTHRLGKPLPMQNTLKITGAPRPDLPPSSNSSPGDGSTNASGQAVDDKEKSREQGKITAVVTVPVSKYEYSALEPPIIETPQLRDMGEATPPLEWIGLHRERLPNLTHQIVIVPLLEVAREVEDAYSKILGSS